MMDEMETLLQGLNEPEDTSAKVEKPLTVWLPKGYRRRYDEIQKKTGRKFSPLLRAALIDLIERAEKVVA